MTGPGGAAAQLVLACDAGQSGTRAVALDGSDSTVGEGTSGGVAHLAARGSARRTVAVVVEAVRAATPAGGVPAVVAVGISGWSNETRLDERLLAAIARDIPARHLALASDAVTAYLGVGGRGPGVVVAAGTGVVVVCADGRGRWARADGLGHVLGDRGGGFWIGREGLWRALADARRGVESALRTSAEHRYGPLELIVDALQRRQDAAAWIAGFAADVAELAAGGDAVARGICDEAGRLLGDSACAAADAVLPAHVPVRLSLTGGLASAAALLLPALQTLVQRERPGSTARAVAGGGLRGAVRLARDPALARWFPGAVLERGQR